MHFPSLSSGCEIAQFFGRYMVDDSMMIVSIETHGITDAMLSWRSTRIESRCVGACVSRHLDDVFVVVAYRCVSLGNNMIAAS
jgi:hypothetical protein